MDDGARVFNESGKGYWMDGFGCLRAEGENRPSRPTHIVCAAFMGGQGAKARSIAYCDDGTTPTLKSAPSGGNTIPDVVICLNDQGGAVMDVTEDVTATLRAQEHGHQPVICFQQNQRDEVQSLEEKSDSLMANAGMKQQNYICIQNSEESRQP